MTFADIQSTKALRLAKANGNKLKLLKPTVQFKLPAVMPTPPTVTVTKSDTSGIANAQPVYAGISGQTGVNSLFKWYGDPYRGDWNGTTYGGTYPDYNFVKNMSISGTPGYLSGAIDVEFVVDDIAFELMVQGKGQSTSWRVLIDEGQGYQAAFADPAATSIPNDASLYQILLAFPTRALRRIRFQSAACGFRGINTGGNGTVLSPSKPIAPKLIVLGDSFTEGTGANGWFNGYATIIGTLLGFDTWTSGSGGTGYINPNSGLNRVKYQDRIQRDVIGYKPDLVIIQGGQNDTTYTKASIQTAADLLYKTLKAGLPGVPIIAISNISVGALTSAITDTRDAIKAAALANGVALIDSLDGVTYDFNGNILSPALGNWYSGNGNIGGVQPTGNRSIYTWTDNGHPSNAGHRYVGERVAGEVYKLLNLI